MDLQRLALVFLALGVMAGDAWQDYYSWQHQLLTAAELFAAAMRTLLFLATLGALLKPGRPLVVLAILSLTLALVRRLLFLGPLLSVLEPSGPYLATFHSGLDLAFRVLLLAWAVSWLRRR